MFSLRNLLSLAWLVGVFVSGTLNAAPSTYPLTVTDLAERQVDIAAPPQRVILGTGRTIYALDLLFEDDLFDTIVAWRGDLIRGDDDSYQAYLQHFPAIAELSQVGLITKGEFDIEYAIGLQADLLILDLNHYISARQTGVIEALASVGTQTVFIDFSADPLANTTPSMTVLGQVFNRQAAAERYNQYYNRHLDALRDYASQIKTRRRVFIERAAGINGLKQCCRTWGEGNFGAVAQAVGLENIGSSLLPGISGQVSTETLLIENPDLYVVTASNWGEHRPDAKNVPLGYSVSEAKAQQAFAGLLSRPGFAVLDATAKGEVYALFHQFYNSPFNIIGAMFFAKWGYPEHYAALDPAAEFRKLHETYLSNPYRGTFGVQAPTAEQAADGVTP